MITDMGIKWTLTGHSERRTLFGETDAEVAKKTKVALDHGMSVLACIGGALARWASSTKHETPVWVRPSYHEELPTQNWSGTQV
jgi:triosephosphate isomerase